MRILIADDDLLTRTILRKAAVGVGYECHVAADGEEAWRIFQERPIDAIISDWMMPGLDGIELCRLVRDANRQEYTFFILLTGLSDKAHMLEGLEAGADDFLPKPVDPRELRARMAAAERVASLYRRLEEQHQQLEARTETLEAVTKEQEAFLYTVSHDLRAPLVAIQGMIGIVAGDYAPSLDAEVQQLLTRIDVNAHKLKEMLDDLLELSRVGRLEFDDQAVDLNTVVADVQEQLAHTLHERGAAIEIASKLPEVRASPTPIRQLFVNLIDNGVKYTPPDRTPSIVITSHDRGEFSEITVADNGVGIPEGHREKVFGLFQRLPKGKTLNPMGSGAGLAIVARVVETSGGKLWLESEEGVGSTFHFTLRKHDSNNGESVADANMREEALVEV